MENPISGHNHREDRLRGYMLSVCKAMIPGSMVSWPDSGSCRPTEILTNVKFNAAKGSHPPGD
eukprot:113016-Hanusia_phi.AAC.1